MIEDVGTPLTTSTMSSSIWVSTTLQPAQTLLISSSGLAHFMWNFSRQVLQSTTFERILKPFEQILHSGFPHFRDFKIGVIGSGIISESESVLESDKTF